MKVLSYFEEPKEKQEYWRSQIATGNWSAAPYLAELLKENKIINADVLLLEDDNKLVSFCTLALQDEIVDESMKPWIGFVYTFPEFRGNRYSEKLINYAMILAKKQGYDHVYISSNNKGMYEKFGFEFLKMMNNVDGHETQVFVRALENVNINDVIDFDGSKDSLIKR